MQRQITDKREWYSIETNQGTWFVDKADVGENIPDSQMVDALKLFHEGTIESWEVVKGFGARLSAPGYLDCTEWTVFDTVKQAEQMAMDVQDACNLSGVVYSFSNILSDVLWPEARRIGQDTEWVNTHPIATLFISKLGSLNGYQSGVSTFHNAWDACEALANSVEV